MRTENAKLENWLQENRERFITFTVEEIADFALVEGFSPPDVSRWIEQTKWGRKVA